MNLYRYVSNDPVNGIDPSRLECIDLWSGSPDYPSMRYRVAVGQGCSFLVRGGLGSITHGGGSRGGDTFARGGGGTSGDRPSNQDASSCPVPGSDTNVYIEVVIVSPPVGPSYIQGTLTDPTTGATASFRQAGIGGITGLAAVRITGLVEGGFDAHSRGILIDGLALTAGVSGKGSKVGAVMDWLQSRTTLAKV